MRISGEYVLKVAALANLEQTTSGPRSILFKPDPHGLARLETLGLRFAHVKTAAVVVVRDGESW